MRNHQGTCKVNHPQRGSAGREMEKGSRELPKSATIPLYKGQKHIPKSNSWNNPVLSGEKKPIITMPQSLQICDYPGHSNEHTGFFFPPVII